MFVDPFRVMTLGWVVFTGGTSNPRLLKVHTFGVLPHESLADTNNLKKIRQYTGKSLFWRIVHILQNHFIIIFLPFTIYRPGFKVLTVTPCSCRPERSCICCG